MSESLPVDHEPLSPSTVLRMEQVCDRFEAAWKAGQRPRIEDYLGDIPEPERSELLRELLGLALDYRRRNGEQPLAEDYLPRFAEHAGLIQSIMQQGAASGSEASKQTALPDAEAKTLPPGSVAPVTETASQPPQPPWIGKYRVIEHLGGGGQAEVFRAVHPSLPGRDVVIKWAKESLPEPIQQMLISEGGILARLEDPRLVRIYDVDVQEGRPFVVMEYVAGRTLQQQIKQGLPGSREAAALVARLAHTLDRVHRQGVCHRDLKPANILIDSAGRSRVLDFGLALMDQPWDQAKRRAGEVSGTFQYMAPEQANGLTERIGPRTDVFGLGAVLYELLTGRAPYQAADQWAVWEQARQAKVIPPRLLNPRIPRALERICLKALAADPERRYASAGQLEAALQRYLRRRTLAWALAGAALVCAAALGLCFNLPPHQDKASLNEPLTGELIVRVWTPGGKGKRGLRVDDPSGAALPVSNGEQVRLEAKLNQPGYVYLLWVDAAGEATALYPWNEEKIVYDLMTPPPDQTPQQVVHSPQQESKGWKVVGQSGLETVLLLARQSPLPDEAKLADVIGKVPPAPLRDTREVAVRGFDLDQPIDTINLGLNRGVGKEAEKIDDPLLQVMERLRPHFEVVRAVRFAHREE